MGLFDSTLKKPGYEVRNRHFRHIYGVFLALCAVNVAE